MNLHTKPANSSNEEKGKKESVLMFVPAGYPRSIAEYLTAIIPSIALIFVFFLALQAVNFALGNSNNTMLFPLILVTCLIPILAGAISVLVLEKVRVKPITLVRGATVGAVAGFVGTLLSSLMMLVAFFMGQKPFGSIADSLLLVALALLCITGIGTLLSALGGAAVAKFMKDV